MSETKQPYTTGQDAAFEAWWEGAREEFRHAGEYDSELIWRAAWHSATECAVTIIEEKAFLKDGTKMLPGYLVVILDEIRGNT